MIELDYKDEIDLEKIVVNECIFILDFSFKPEVMEKIFKKTDCITWIDHHKTAFEYKYSREIKGLRSTSYSACELVWKYLYQIGMPRAVELIGDRDKWAWQFGKATAYFNTGMNLYPHQPKDKIWDKLLDVGSEAEVSKIMEKGKFCLKFRDQICNDYANSYGFETEFEDYKCFALNLYMFGSEAFGNRMDKYDVCLSYIYLGNDWQIGLYSKTIDVSKIAQRYGGGGHTGAAGFVSKELPFKKKK